MATPRRFVVDLLIPNTYNGMTAGVSVWGLKSNNPRKVKRAVLSALPQQLTSRFIVSDVREVK